ncbi:BEACH domain-containing protein [Pavlovales sp. CCMP2436]|nr:BEACH domain-containing protein [Pavlovales sp. CCMP2436]
MCGLVKGLRVIPGTLLLTPTHLYFAPDADEALASNALERLWPLVGLRELHARRYLLRASALELVFDSGQTFFLHLVSAAARCRMQAALYARPLPALAPGHSRVVEPGGSVPRQEAARWTRQWRERQISTFDYLARVNSLAQRTPNDLTQYPPFPWVLSNYESEDLDLSDPANFRDLSRPVGALLDDSHSTLRENYALLAEQWQSEGHEGGAFKPFHYGSHYSSMAIVLFYLLRVEPFTTAALQLQDGVFDLSDRLFHSVAATWDHCARSTNDVKELIPEMYYSCAHLRNDNGFEFGGRQDGARVDDVLLPPWAKDCPHEFTRQMRAALESEPVSQRLHLWLDLVFGVKQRGQAAVEALNVFHGTYDSAEDLGLIEDPFERERTVQQVLQFGQTPPQLFSSPHPPRAAGPSIERALGAIAQVRAGLRGSSAEKNLPDASAVAGALQSRKGGGCEVLALLRGAEGRRLLALDARLETHSWAWSSGAAGAAGELGALDVTGVSLPWAACRVRRSAAQHLASLADGPSAPVGSQGFVAVCGPPAAYGLAVWAIGRSHADHNFTLLAGHPGARVTCVAATEDGSSFVSGSDDCTAVVWTMELTTKSWHFHRRLCAHHLPVTCVAAHRDLDVVLSGSLDGACAVHALQSGRFLRALCHPRALPLRACAVSGDGIAALCAEGGLIALFGLDGAQLGRLELQGAPLVALELTPSSAPSFLLVVEPGRARVLKSSTLEEVGSFLAPTEITSATLLANSTGAGVSLGAGALAVVLGLDDGRVLNYALNRAE